MEKKHRRHLNTHVGLCKELRNLSEDRIVEIFEIMKRLDMADGMVEKGMVT